ncbi:MAG: hypothetical protein HZB54_09370 [Deltaproteobacteria bacterium]|nr:hypothetical protein [Deltaproteobacteria bacterium]
MKFYAGITAALLAILIIGWNNTSQAAEKGATKKVKDVQAVEELYAKKDKLNGKKVVVRGKVVKFNGGIMGRNWIHLQDGSGKQGTNDITITTNQNANVGDTVVATGVMAINKEFGGQYKYEVIIEQATIAVE